MPSRKSTGAIWVPSLTFGPVPPETQPTLFEGLGYGGYLLVAAILMFGVRARRPKTAAPDREGARAESSRSEGALTPS